MEKELKGKIQFSIYASFFTLIITLIGIFLGQYLSQKNALDMYRIQRDGELRERSYAKLVSLKLPWSQIIQTHLEATILSDYYYTRFQIISFDKDDLEEAKRQNDRAINLIPQISSIQKELFESLAEVRISYDLTYELTNTIDSIYNFKSITIEEFDRNKIKTLSDLDAAFKMANLQMMKACKSEYQNKIESILPHLLSQIKKQEK